MSIANYGQLRTALADWSTRSGFTAWLPDFVTLFETIVNAGEGEPGDDGYIAPLRCRQMISLNNALAINASNQATLPTDFLDVVRVQSTNPVQTMLYADPSWYSQAYPSGDPGDFVYYTLLGNYLISGQNVTLDYYQSITTLAGTADATTNWLLTLSPNAYLFGGLYALSIFNKSAEKAAEYRGLMRGAINAVRGLSTFKRVGPLVMRSSSTAF